MHRGLFALLFLIGLNACSSFNQASRQISAEGMRAYELSVAGNNQQLALAWYGGTEEVDAIYLQWLTAQGKPEGAPRQITDGRRSAYEVDLQFIDQDALLVWYEKDKATGALTAYLERQRHDGQVLWRQTLNAQGGWARNPVVRVANSTIHVAWIETPTGASSTEPAVWTADFDAAGKPSAMPRRAAAASSNTWNLNATVNKEGTFYVAYDAKLSTRAKELQLLTITEGSIRHATLSPDDGFDSIYPDIGINDNGVVALTWFDTRDGNQEVYLSVGSLAELLSSNSLHPQRITHTPANSIGAYLAWNGARLALVWCDAQPGQQELYARFFNVRGQGISDVQRLTHTATQSSIPSIRAGQQGFWVAWNEYRLEGEGAHAHIVSSTAMLQRLQ
ncbi:MAG: hypothetical protein QM808_15025 [Steroidobacteraceae bacterium]